jgi:hypothetical protein
MLQTLSDKLLSILEQLKGEAKPFVEVLDYHTLETSGYPYLTFEPIGFDAVIADTCNNLRTYNFQCLMFQEITDAGGRKEAKEILIKAVDDVIRQLDANYTLDDTVTMVQPVTANITPFTINN